MIHGLIVRAPSRSIGANHFATFALRLTRACEAVQTSGGGHPICVAHGAGPQPSSAVALGVVETIPDLIWLGISSAGHCASFKIHKRKFFFQGQHQAATRTQIHRSHNVVKRSKDIFTGAWIESLHAIAANVNPIQLVYVGAPNWRLANNGVIAPGQFRLYLLDVVVLATRCGTAEIVTHDVPSSFCA